MGLHPSARGDLLTRSENATQHQILVGKGFSCIWLAAMTQAGSRDLLGPPEEEALCRFLLLIPTTAGNLAAGERAGNGKLSWCANIGVTPLIHTPSSPVFQENQMCPLLMFTPQSIFSIGFFLFWPRKMLWVSFIPCSIYHLKFSIFKKMKSCLGVGLG